MKLVGTAGFEPATPCTPSKCATRLRYVPIDAAVADDGAGLTQEFYTSQAEPEICNSTARAGPSSESS